MHAAHKDKFRKVCIASIYWLLHFRAGRDFQKIFELFSGRKHEHLFDRDENET